MARETNEERIVALIRRRPGLDDDEISHSTGIGPRQQVNQICRRLESRGVLMRSGGPRGKIVNELVDACSPKALRAAPPHDRRSHIGSKTPPPVEDKTWRLPVRSDLSETLLIVPCSKSKKECPGRQTTGPCIRNRLPASLAERLDLARAANRQRVGMDDRTLAPAWKRYNGHFYQAAGDTLAEAVSQRLHLLILSGGYGVLLACEPIGLYDATLKTSWWPECVLEGVLAGYARHYRLKCMRAFVSRTTAYRKVVERANWNAAGVADAVLLMRKGNLRSRYRKRRGRRSPRYSMAPSLTTTGAARPDLP